jgi:hypothetical protein
MSRSSRGFAIGRREKLLVWGIVFAAGAAPWLAETPQQYFAFLALLLAATAATFLWIRAGARGIPVLPVICLAYLPYFAWPALTARDELLQYSPDDVLTAALTVAGSLAAATLAWAVLLMRSRSLPQGQRHQSLVIVSREVGLIFAGLGAGLAFHLGVTQGWIFVLGSAFGVVRTVAVSFSTIACFLLGVSYARGRISARQWAAALGIIGIIVTLAFSTLFLVGGITYLLSLGFGYVVVRRKVPWVALAALISVLAVLHAGKGEMRAKYWEAGANYGTSVGITELPGFMAEWVGNGLTKSNSDSSSEASVIGRASLLQMMLLVQDRTPDPIDYLHGETYSLLPSILIPRFIETEKPSSQVGMDLLNVRYGLLTAEGTASTAIGWGMTAEAYANFGLIGTLGVGIFLGLFCGGLAIWGDRSDLISFPTLFSIATMMILLNIELDFIQAFSSLVQAFVSVFLFSQIYRSIIVRPNARA